jgi:dUTP pyrophosphatase
VDLSACPLNLSIDIRPRSSVWKTGMVLSNCEGTVDEGYTNEISAVFYHVLPNMPRYKIGDKIAQMKIGITLPIGFIEVEELNKTERGMNGYGSSGK